MDTDEIFKKNRQETHTSSQSTFTNRQKNLFEELDKAREQVRDKIICDEESMEIDTSSKITLKRKRSETKHFRGKESIFKRPELPLNKCLPPRMAPDFQKNPHKWTKYSLEDVHLEDMSERSNTSAALSFLQELEDRKNIEKIEAVEQNSKIIFKKRIKDPQSIISTSKVQTVERQNEKLAFRGSKIVMPEYVVGQKPKTIKKNTIAAEKGTEKVKEIKLDHLVEDEDEAD